MEKLKLKRLEVKNLQGIKIGELVMRAPVMEVSSNGHNAQGKSSLLTGLDTILFGKSALGKQPIREGAKNAEITGTFEGMTVKVTVTPSSVQYVVVDENGMVKTNRQLIDTITRGVNIDPVKFCSMSDKEQFAVLLSTLGITDQLEKFAAEYKAAYDTRTYRNREAKQAEARRSGMPYPDSSIPAEPVSAADILKQVSEETKKRDHVNSCKFLLEGLVKDRDKAQAAHEEADRNVQLWITESKKREEIHREAERRMLDMEKTLSELPKPGDVSELTMQLIGVEETNKSIAIAARQREDYAKAQADAKRLAAEAEECSAKLEEIEMNRKALLKGADFPVEGMSVDLVNGVVTLNGIPFRQCSTAETMIAAAMIQIAAHPAVPIAVFRNAALIGTELREVIISHAIQFGWQVIFESLDKSDIPGIVIEDGMVVEVVQ